MQPEMTSMLSHKWAICDESCVSVLIEYMIKFFFSKMEKFWPARLEQWNIWPCHGRLHAGHQFPLLFCIPLTDYMIVTMEDLINTCFLLFSSFHWCSSATLTNWLNFMVTKKNMSYLRFSIHAPACQSYNFWVLAGILALQKPMEIPKTKLYIMLFLS